MQAFANVQALVFDVFGTVVDWRGGVARESAAFLARYAPDADPAAFADAWRRRYSPSMEEVRSGRRLFVRLDVLHRENLEAVLPEFGMDPVAIPPSELDALNLAWRRLDPWPDSVPGLTRLKGRFIIAPLSNGKPMPEAYLRTADTLMLKPEQVGLVAAHNNDLAAARRCGLRTALIPRPTEHGPGQTSDLRPEEEWDAVASGIEDLASQLGA